MSTRDRQKRSTWASFATAKWSSIQTIIKIVKKLKTLSLFLLFITALLVAGATYAVSPAETYGSCGPKPSALEKFFTSAQKIRTKCIEDIYAANKEKTRQEIEELINTSHQLGAELKKVAIKVDFNITQCSPRRGEPDRDPVLVKRCEDIVRTQNAVLTRVDELTGWNERPTPKITSKEDEAGLNPPCPTKEKLQEMQMARMFNKKLYQIWEKCKMQELGGY